MSLVHSLLHQWIQRREQSPDGVLVFLWMAMSARLKITVDKLVKGIVYCLVAKPLQLSQILFNFLVRRPLWFIFHCFTGFNRRPDASIAGQVHDIEGNEGPMQPLVVVTSPEVRKGEEDDDESAASSSSSSASSSSEETTLDSRHDGKKPRKKKRGEVREAGGGEEGSDVRDGSQRTSSSDFSSGEDGGDEEIDEFNYDYEALLSSWTNADNFNERYQQQRFGRMDDRGGDSESLWGGAVRSSRSVDGRRFGARSVVEIDTASQISKLEFMEQQLQVLSDLLSECRDAGVPATGSDPGTARRRSSSVRLLTSPRGDSECEVFRQESSSLELEGVPTPVILVQSQQSPLVSPPPTSPPLHIPDPQPQTLGSTPPGVTSASVVSSFPSSDPTGTRQRKDVGHQEKSPNSPQVTGGGRLSPYASVGYPMPPVSFSQTVLEEKQKREEDATTDANGVRVMAPTRHSLATLDRQQEFNDSQQGSATPSSSSELIERLTAIGCQFVTSGQHAPPPSTEPNDLASSTPVFASSADCLAIEKEGAVQRRTETTVNQSPLNIPSITEGDSGLFTTTTTESHSSSVADPAVPVPFYGHPDTSMAVPASGQNMVPSKQPGQDFVVDMPVFEVSAAKEPAGGKSK